MFCLLQSLHGMEYIVMPVIQTTSRTIKNLTNIRKQTNNNTTSHVGIYSIPCKDCNKHYIGGNPMQSRKKNLQTIYIYIYIYIYIGFGM